MVVTLDRKWGNAIKLVDFSDLSKLPVISESQKGVEVKFDDSDLRDFLLDINSSISLIGTDYSGGVTVNSTGEDLYAIYDEIKHQIK